MNSCIGSKEIYLTFDDGPHEIYTVELLDLLKKHEIKATFFVTGNSLLKNKQIGRRIVEEGHILGNHTHTHKVLTEISKKEMSEEIITCQNLIGDLQNNSTRLFRPPCGLAGIRELIFLKQNNFKYCLWSIDSKDSLFLGTDVLIKRLKSAVCNKSVILFHDDARLCIDIIQVILPFWISNGYTFKTMNDK